MLSKTMIDVSGSYEAFPVLQLLLREFAADVQTLENNLKLYQKAINEIDDYFEYSHKCDTDKAMIHVILLRLTKGISNENA